MDRPTAAVTCDLEVRLMVPGDAWVPLPVLLRYDSSDPFAVQATFRTGDSDGVHWVFAREMLALGIGTPTGEGDVRVWPSPGDGGQTVFIALSSPDGKALLVAPAATLRGFLERTYAVVAPGSESPHLDVDAVIQQLLAS